MDYHKKARENYEIVVRKMKPVWRIESSNQGSKVLWVKGLEKIWINESNFNIYAYETSCLRKAKR